ncbi:hypothetical protein OG225_40870 (plasmid) [Nocardia sp. NBC_01377]|uniref:hypothetical protein n=1 Tax=Nocardia sp. NBC_01377 TaxID=2903595 RepID=UPI003244A6A1
MSQSQPRDGSDDPDEPVPGQDSTSAQDEPSPPGDPTGHTSSSTDTPALPSIIESNEQPPVGFGTDHKAQDGPGFSDPIEPPNGVDALAVANIAEGLEARDDPISQVLDSGAAAQLRLDLSDATVPDNSRENTLPALETSFRALTEHHEVYYSPDITSSSGLYIEQVSTTGDPLEYAPRSAYFEAFDNGGIRREWRSYSDLESPFPPELSDEDLFYALMAEDSYRGESGKEFGGYSRLTEPEMREVGIKSELFRKRLIGLRAAVYGNDQGDLVVGFGGTSVRRIVPSVPDVVTDVRQGIGRDTRQYNAAAIIAAEVSRAESRSVTYVGHSLGAGLAQTASILTKKPAVLLNAAGIHDNTIANASKNDLFGVAKIREAMSDGFIRNVVVEGEILTRLQEKIARLPESLGKKITLPPIAGTTSIQRHGMESVIASIRQQLSERIEYDNPK